MTIEEAMKLTSLDDIKKAAEEFLIAANSAETTEERGKLEEGLDQIINLYTSISKAAFYKAASESENPMHYACIEFSFPVIRVKETKDDETGVVIRSIADSVRPCDLGDMYKRIENFGADKNWIHQTEKFNYYLTVRAAQRVGAKELKQLITGNDSFTMSDIARQIDMGKNPCSNTQLLKTLQSIITAMLGDGWKANSHDVNYLVDVYATDNKKSKTSITLANHKTLRNYLKKVCHRILTNGEGYDAVQREVKEKK